MDHLALFGAQFSPIIRGIRIMWRPHRAPAPRMVGVWLWEKRFFTHTHKLISQAPNKLLSPQKSSIAALTERALRFTAVSPPHDHVHDDLSIKNYTTSNKG